MTKDIAKSIKAKLLNIAKKEELDYQQLIIRYLYERLLYRLSVSPYKDKFCLKGGALLYAFEKEFPRPTLDIDFLGMKIKNELIPSKMYSTKYSLFRVKTEYYLIYPPLMRRKLMKVRHIKV